MKPPPFEYFQPRTLDEAIDLLSRTEQAKILAGGQSLMSMLNLRYVFPDALIDINNIFELAGIEGDSNRLRIGAMTRQRRIEQDGLVGTVAPIFHVALKLVGHRQTRNRGTIGGSLCHLDPASELPSLALLYDADIEVMGPNGRRTLPASEFVLGFMMPNIGADEVVTAVELSPWAEGHGYGFNEFARRHGDFALALAACLIERDSSGIIQRCAIVIGGIGSVAQRHPQGEAALIGGKGDREAIEAAVSLVSELEAMGDFHGGVEYRRSVARTMLRKSLNDAMERA